MFDFLVNKSKEHQLQGPRSQLQHTPFQGKSTSDGKENEQSTYTSPVPNPDNEDDGSLTLPQTFGNPLKAKLLYLLKEKRNTPLLATLRSQDVDTGTETDIKEDLNILEWK